MAQTTITYDDKIDGQPAPTGVVNADDLNEIKATVNANSIDVQVQLDSKASQSQLGDKASISVYDPQVKSDDMFLMDNMDEGADTKILTAQERSDIAANTAKSLSDVNGWTGQQYFALATLTDAANISWNLNTQQAAAVTLTDNRTLDNPTNLKAGATYIVKVIQDSTGSRTLAFGTAYKWPGGTVPVLSTSISAVDVLTFFCDGTNMYGVFSGDFS